MKNPLFGPPPIKPTGPDLYPVVVGERSGAMGARKGGGPESQPIRL
jgi:hypothetical protein